LLKKLAYIAHVMKKPQIPSGAISWYYFGVRMEKSVKARLFSSRAFLVGLCVVAGLIWAYDLGRLEFVRNVFDALSIRLSAITPNPIFLSDVAAFEAAIIAFLVPLSIEIISKISERYNSDVITQVFERQWENRMLAPFLLINAVAAVILRFLVSDDANSLAWKLAAWLVLSVFVCIAYAIYRVIVRIKAFMSNTNFVIDQLYRDVEKSLE